MDELKLSRCPFCGGTEQRVKSSGRWGWFVSCRCCAVGPSATSKDEAIAAWNHRADERTYMSMMPEFTTDEFKARARRLISDMHGLLQRVCESRDECGRDCELWPDHNKQCDLRDVEERMAVLGIEVLE